jgi:hypothetical protein
MRKQVVLSVLAALVLCGSATAAYFGLGLSGVVKPFLPPGRDGDGAQTLSRGYDAQNAHMVDYIHASTSRESGKLLALDANKHFPVDVIADNAIIGYRKIAPGTVTQGRLASNSVTSDKISDGQVKAADLAAGSVSSSKIVNGAVGTAKLANGAVTAGKLNASGLAADRFLKYDGSSLVWDVPGGGGGDADTVDGFDAYATPHSNELLALNGEVKFPNSVFYTGSGGGLDADTVDGKHCTEFLGKNEKAADSDKVDGYHAGNGSGQVPISNGTVCTNLNADKLDGLDSSQFLNTSSDYGRSGVASDLYEGSTKLSDKYFGKSIPVVISGARSGSYILCAENSASSAWSCGLYGHTSASSGDVWGVYGSTSSSSGKGVMGYAASTSGTNYGVYGLTDSDQGGYGVYGKLEDVGTYGFLAGGIEGVYGQSMSSSGTGVAGVCNTGGAAWGVYGYSSSGCAGYFSGNVYVSGRFDCPDKHFKIDHPLDPENMYLEHSCVESSERKDVYDGTVLLDRNGEASVQLPDWFEALNCDFRYQLTPVGAPAPDLYIAQEIQDGCFCIAGGLPGMKVSWQVTGVRQDPYALAHPMEVEVEKPEIERGYYLHPELYGQPETRSVEWAVKPDATRQMMQESPPHRPE